MDNQAIIKEWISAFGKDVDNKIIQSHVTAYGNYLWHLFTWGEVPCMEGDDARKAFDDLQYTEAIIFYDGYSNGIEGVSCVGKFSADEIDRNENRDVYVVAKDFSWTYVRTHETERCGPYFCANK